MARIVRHTRTITQELRPPWQYVLLGMALLGAIEVGGVLLWWLLANWNF